MIDLDALAVLTPLEAGPRGKQCTVDWLYEVLDKRPAESLRRALANRAAPTDEIIGALHGQHGIPLTFLARINIDRHRNGKCRCPR